MEYAKIENGRITEIAAIQVFAPNTSFTDGVPNPAFLELHGLLPVETATGVDPQTQRVEWVEPFIYQGQVRTWRLVNLTADEREYQQSYAEQVAWQSVRAQRDQMLQATDWTQVADAPVDRQAWATYRQALRDITTQADPQAITWPTRP